MTSKTGKETIAIHILPNISKYKGNQTMKFGQLIEYNRRNNFLKKSCTKCGSEAFPDPFKIQIERISGSIDENFIQFVFIVLL